MALRVVSYNVRSFRAGVGAAVEAVSADAPDLVMLQEYGAPYRLRGFARATGLDWASSYALWNRMRNAVLFRTPWRLERTDIHRFTKTPRQHRRGFVAARLENGRARMTAVSVHLGLSAHERPRHAAELVAFLRDESTPVIIAGDLNEEPGGDAVGILTAAFRSSRSTAGGGHPSFPADEPTAAIDDVLVAGGVGIASFRVGYSDAARRASDHRPVIADLELLPPPASVG